MANLGRLTVVSGLALLSAGSVSTLAAQARPDVRPAEVRLREADSLFRAGVLDTALQRYDEIVRRDSTNSRAVFQSAVLRSWRNELAMALRLLERYIVLEPGDLEGRVAFARVLGWAGRFSASVATYDTVLSREADYRDAALGRATTLGWWGRFGAADSTYRRWLATHPADTGASLGRAQILSWTGHFDEALTIYRSFSQGWSEARQGEARVLTWKGDLLGGEALWASLTREAPRDADAWVALAQVRLWLGRYRAARDAIDSALRVHPGYGDALQQRQLIDAELAPVVTAVITSTGDSDGNTSVLLEVTGGIAMPAGRRLEVGAQSRRATLGPLAASANSLRANWGVQSASGRLSLSLDAGAALLTASATPGEPERETMLVSGSARVATRLGARVGLGASGQRSLFDEVAGTIRSAVVLEAFDGDVSIRLPARFTASAALGTGRVARGTGGDNDRWTGSASLRWSLTRTVSFAVATRAFGYERPTPDGYFAPRRYQLSQVTARWSRGRDFGWQVGGDAGAGRQHVRLRDDADVSGRLAWNAAASVGYRLRPGVEWFARAAVANVAAPGTVVGDAEYRYGAVSIGGRFLF